jgi:WD40 repeat protein
VNPRVTITAWNLASGRELFTTVDPLPKEAFEAIQNPASSVMAISFRDGAIHLMQATGTRQLLHMLAGHADAPVMAFSPDSRLLASAGGLGYAGSDANPPLGDPTVKVWDVATGALLRTFTGHTNKINALAFSADGSRLASGSGANVTTAGLPTFTTPGSNPFANARDENSVRVWDVASGTPLQAFTGLAWRIRAVALSPDGRYVAAGSQDNTIKLWDTTDGTLVAGLFDPRALEPDKAVNYAGTTLGAGQAAQRAYPTSAALPAAATCTCNCVAGSYAPKPPAGGGGPCSLVCVCVPVQYPGF